MLNACLSNDMIACKKQIPAEIGKFNQTQLAEMSVNVISHPSNSEKYTISESQRLCVAVSFCRNRNRLHDSMHAIFFFFFFFFFFSQAWSMSCSISFMKILTPRVNEFMEFK